MELFVYALVNLPEIFVVSFTRRTHKTQCRLYSKLMFITVIV